MDLDPHPNERTAERPTLPTSLIDELGIIASLPEGKERREKLQALRRKIEIAYCAKVGVVDDDIAHCAYFQAGRCGYHNALRVIAEEHGVNLISNEVRAC